jgi:hypothetical protein
LKFVEFHGSETPLVAGSPFRFNKDIKWLSLFRQK